MEGGKVRLSKTLPAAVDKELAAEKLVERTRDGIVVDVYEAGRRRNEALDCLVYALAVFRLRNPNFETEEGEGDEDTAEKQQEEETEQDNRQITESEQNSQETDYEEEDEYEDDGVYEIEW